MMTPAPIAGICVRVCKSIKDTMKQCLFQGNINFDTNGSRPDHIINLQQYREFGKMVYSCACHLRIQIGELLSHTNAMIPIAFSLVFGFNVCM